MAEKRAVKYVVQSYAGGYAGPAYHYTWERLADALDYIKYHLKYGHEYEKDYSYLILRFDDDVLVSVIGPLNKANDWLGFPFGGEE